MSVANIKCVIHYTAWPKRVSFCSNDASDACDGGKIGGVGEVDKECIL